MRITVLLIGVILGSASLIADDHIVDFDRKIDFQTIRTFAFGERSIKHASPDLNNSLVLTRTTDTIRMALTAKGLKETSDRPDVMVTFTVSGQDYSVGPFGRASQIDPNRGARGRGQGGTVDPQSDQPVAFTEGELVLDLVARESGLLIWRGVYRDSEKNSGKFAQKLPNDAKTLLAQYPPKKR